MRHGQERREIEGATRTIDPSRIGLEGLAQRVLVADRAGEIGVAVREIGVLGEQARRHRRSGTVGPARNVAGIDEAQPAKGNSIVTMRDARFDEASQVGPGQEAILARHTRLRVVQAQAEVRDRRVVLARGSGQGIADARDRLGIAISVASEQILCLLLQVIEIRPLGEPLHGKPPCMKAPTTRKSGCTKVSC